jgi:hypothetical protein
MARALLCCLAGCSKPLQPLPEQSIRPLLGVQDWIREDHFEQAKRRPSSPYQTALVAYRFNAWTYAEMDPASRRVGSVREGRVVWGKAEASHRGCPEGWYALAQGGYACASGSFRRVDDEAAEARDLTPALDRALPYDYVQVTRGAARYDRIPSAEEECRLGSADTAPGAPLDRRMDGDFFLAVAAREEDHGRSFYRTLRDKYVHVEEVTSLPHSQLHGKKDPALPIAFVLEPDTPLLSLGDGAAREIGRAERYSTFPLDRMVTRAQERYAVDPQGRAAPASAVRVVRPLARPAEVGPGEKWIVVDLSDQTLVAYEGDRPVLATLVSSGREGHETPTGSFRIRTKYVSKTMRGEDPADGPYEVHEVPWTMYYNGAYALHGAYWHDEFGHVKSHGCTNLAPADARWLLRWTDPPLPAGWHSILSEGAHAGTRVFFVP